MNRKIYKGIALSLSALLLLSFFGVLLLNLHVKNSTSERILTPEEAQETGEFDCILVLGCLVREDESPSDMLRDRLDTALFLYRNGAAPKLLMSGDHGRKDYDEVGAMKAYAMEAGVSSSDVFMDHAGFSTYESLYRTRDVFLADRILIVTQEYHLYRALYVAKALGLEAFGVSADLNTYAGQGMREAREVLARTKDCFTALFKPAPTYLGEAIPVNSNGDLTNDKPL